MTTPKLIIANWKMAVDRAQVVELTRAAGTALGKARERAGQSGAVAPDVILCPPYVYIPAVAAVLSGGVQLGAQDVAVPHHPKGAQTGDVSPAMLRDTLCTSVIIGHSERRAGHFETNDLVAQKVRAAVTHGLTPILCVGETADERGAGQGADVVRTQILAALSQVRFSDGQEAPEVVIAYEPVWAISGGNTAVQPASIHDITAMHAVIHTVATGPLAHIPKIRMVYGGSVTSDNIAKILAVPYVDGVLVGGASCVPQSLAALIEAGVVPLV
jgi:triosephosphate isomerase